MNIKYIRRRSDDYPSQKLGGVTEQTSSSTTVLASQSKSGANLTLTFVLTAILRRRVGFLLHSMEKGQYPWSDSFFRVYWALDTYSNGYVLRRQHNATFPHIKILGSSQAAAYEFLKYKLQSFFSQRNVCRFSLSEQIMSNNWRDDSAPRV